MENLYNYFKSKKVNSNGGRLLLLFLFVSALFTNGLAQNTITVGDPNTASGGSGWMVFNLVNNNNVPIIITDVSVECNSTANNAEAYIYTNSTPVNGAPGAISSNPAWVLGANQTLNVTNNTTNLVSVISGANVLVPANSTIGVAIGLFSSTGSAISRYSTSAGLGATLPIVHSAAGVDLVFSSTSAYAGGTYTAAPTFTPRGFIGSISFIQATPCNGPVSAGVVSASPSVLTCIGQEFVLSSDSATVASGIIYQWQSSPAGLNNFTNITGANNISLIVNNMAGDTDYRLVVTCTNDNSSDISNIVTVTQPLIGANFIQDFDTTSVGTASKAGANYPDCWSLIDTVTTGYGYVIASTPVSAPNSYRLYRTNATAGINQEITLVSPKTQNLGNGTKQLRFSVRSYSSTTYLNKLEILSMPNNNDSNGATVIATVINDNTNGQVWKEYIVPIPATTNEYFGFRLAYNGTTTASSVLIDDINYEDLDSCSPPINFNVSNVTSNSVDLNWDSSISSGVTQYEYEIRQGTTVVSTGIVTGTSVTVSTGLNPANDYTAFIRSVCGNSFGNWSSFELDFETTCVALATNFVEDFDSTQVGTASKAGSNFPRCWSYIDEVTTGYGYVVSATPQSTPNVYRLYRTNATAGINQDLVLISPETVNLGDGTKQLRFSVRSYSTTTYLNKLEILSMPDNTTTAGSTVIATIYNDNTNGQTWKEYIVPLPKTSNDYFGFNLDYNGTTTASSILIDDINYENLSLCIFPMNLNVSNVTETSATLTWDSSLASGVTQYEYEVRTSGDAGSGSSGLIKSGTITGLSVALTGLQQGTKYTVYIRSKCGTSSGAWSMYPLEFYTLCGVITGDLYENFDTTKVGSTTDATYPYCWTYIDDVATTGYGYVESTSSNSSLNSYRIYRTNSTSNKTQNVALLSPTINNLGNGNKRLRFQAMATNTNVTNLLEVIVADGNLPNSTFTVLDTIVVNHTQFKEYIVYVPSTSDQIIGFRLPHNNSTALVDINIDDVYVEDIPPLKVTLNKTDNVCYNAFEGEIFSEVQGGKPPYQYNWSYGNLTTQDVFNLPSGTHTLTVTDDRGTVVTESITIIEPTQIISNVVVNNVSCIGNTNGSVSINPSGGVSPYTILWSDNYIGSNRKNLAPGAYSFTIRDANGCPVTETINILEPAQLITTVTNQTNVSVYGGSDGSATISVIGGTPPYTYQWTPGNITTATASNLSAGTYNVLITDANGCTTNQAVVITQPSIPYQIQLLSRKDVSCNGANDGSISVQVLGGTPPYTYEWSLNVGNTSTINNLSPGVYTLTVTDSDNNIITADYSIFEPAVLTSSITSYNNVDCMGNPGEATVTVTGGTAPYEYLWSNGMTTTTATNLIAGSYNVIITDANGCTANSTVTISQSSPIVVNETITHISCNGLTDGSISLNVSGGSGNFTYSWSNLATGPSITGLSKGVYTVTITDDNNCTEVRSFTINEPAFVYPPVAVNQSFCAGQNATLADVQITGNNIKWYSSSTGGSALAPTTVLANGVTYYASQTVGLCESARAAVQITLSAGTPLSTTQLTVCDNTRVQNMVVDGLNYVQLKWYDTATSTTPLVSSQLLTSKTYYVSSFVGNCESVRTPIQVTVLGPIAAPTATVQNVCRNSTLNDLVVTTIPGATLRWYNSLQSITPFAGNTIVSSGTYYVQQVVSNCTSPRVAVQVQVINATAPAMTNIATCEGVTIADFNAGTNYLWFSDNVTNTALPDTTVITSGTYYIALELSGCVSPRAMVTVVVNTRPAAPTGMSVQLFKPGSTVGDLRMNEPNVKWYSTYQNAKMQVNELASYTPLQNGATYYAILTGANNCGSEPTSVQVSIDLQNKEFDLSKLNYYPNPIENEFNIVYVQDIIKVEVFAMNGQRIINKEFNNKEVKLDFSAVSSGNYMIKIHTNDAVQFIKIIKS